jgi:hypothetical protein
MPIIPNRYNKYAVSSHASNNLTYEASFFFTMDVFRDSVLTSLSLAWS